LTNTFVYAIFPTVEKQAKNLFSTISQGLKILKSSEKFLGLGFFNSPLKPITSSPFQGRSLGFGGATG